MANDWPGRKRARWWAALAAGAALCAVGVGWFAWRRPGPAPEPPAIDLQSADPKVAAAVEAARARVKEAPHSGDAWGRLGRVLFANGYNNEAERCFAHAGRLQPNEPRWPYLRAYLLLSHNRDAALTELRRAVELCEQFDKTNTTPRLLLAEVYLERDEHDKVAVECQRVLAQEPDNPRAHFALGASALARDDLKASLSHLSRAATSPFVRQRACNQLAAVSRRLGDEAAAEEFSRKAREGPPDAGWKDPYAQEANRLGVGRQDQLLRAERLEAEGRLNESARALSALLDDFPDARSHLALGVALAKVGDFQGAERSLRTALRDAPNSAGGHYALCVALFGQGEALQRAGQSASARAKYEGTIASARRALELKPDHAMAYLFRGRAQERLGQRPLAIEAYRQASRCRPDLIDPYLRLAEALVEAGERAEALKQLRLAAELAPANDPRPRATLKRLRGAGGKPK